MARMSFAATSRRDNRGVFRDCERKKVAPHAGQRPQVPQRWPYSSPAALPAVGGIAIESVQSTRLKQPPHSFAEFWRHYVLAHRHPATRAFHFTGTLAAWGAARRGNPVAQPVAGGGGAAAAVRPRL